ncbi:MAG TPA: FixH family protein [candidate division Zixibacteria bacterium]|nr:FixH family protein [candidate division Zixibacteria bacterium]
MSHAERQKPASRWGWGIAALYGGFVVFILSIVGYVVFVDFQLVEDDYYSRQVAYQERIDSEARAQALPERPEFSLDTASGDVILSFPQELRETITGGIVAFMRPSDKQFDETYALALDDHGQQRFDRERFINGLWRVTLSWSAAGESYSLKSQLILP